MCFFVPRSWTRQRFMGFRALVVRLSSLYKGFERRLISITCRHFSVKVRSSYSQLTDWFSLLELQREQQRHSCLAHSLYSLYSSWQHTCLAVNCELGVLDIDSQVSGAQALIAQMVSNDLCSLCELIYLLADGCERCEGRLVRESLPRDLTCKER